MQHGSTALLSITLTILCCGVGLCQRKPNIVLVMADDHGYGDTGFTGHPFVQTPNLDDMASAGVVFDRFYASAPVCSPTRASVLTGRHPFRTNVPNHGHYMRPHEVTIAEALTDAGYLTGHFGKWHIGSVQPDSPTNPGGAGFDEWLSGLNFFDNDPYLSHNGKYVQFGGSGTSTTMDATLDFLERGAASSQPMFAVVWFPAPHDPHQEVPQDAENAARMYEDEPTKKPGYFREITLLDQQVGRLRAKLRELQIHENTLLIYTSDNGGLVEQSSGGRAKKGSIYEGGLRVPTVFEWPGTLSGKHITTPAFSADFYPTILGIAGVEVKTQPILDGIDLQKIIAGEQSSRRPMGFWHGHTPGQSTWSDRIIRALKAASDQGLESPYPNRVLKNVNERPEFGTDATRGHAAWNAWPWKLHRIQHNESVKLELYNLEDDPMEATDRSQEQPARVAAMLGALEAWQQSVLDSWSGKDFANF